MVQINIQFGDRGIEKIVALGRTSDDRRETFQALARIEPHLDEIDRVLKTPAKK